VPLSTTVGEDVEEAQELPMNPARGSHRTSEEGEGRGACGIPVTLALHLFACLVLHEPVGVIGSLLAVEAHVREVTAATFVRTDNVSDEIPEATEVGVLDNEVAVTGLAVALLHRWDVVSTGGQARVVADCSSAIRTVTCASFRLPVGFLQVCM
jgi:hypothetical protein